jgi:hypothetical protein
MMIWHPNRDLKQMYTVNMINELSGSSNRRSALYNSITHILTILPSTNSVAINQQDIPRKQSSATKANSSSASREIPILHQNPNVYKDPLKSRTADMKHERYLWNANSVVWDFWIVRWHASTIIICATVFTTYALQFLFNCYSSQCIWDRCLPHEGMY